MGVCSSVIFFYLGVAGRRTDDDRAERMSVGCIVPLCPIIPTHINQSSRVDTTAAGTHPPQAMWLLLLSLDHNHSRAGTMPSRRCLKHLVFTIASANAFVNRRNGYAPTVFRLTDSQLTGLSLYTARSNYSESVVERSYSPELDSAYEWLARDRFLNEPEKNGEIRWFHPNTAIPDSAAGYGENDHDVVERMPLYPLGAVHIPYSEENYTIINIEPKNVKMALVSTEILCFYYIQSTSLASAHVSGILLCFSKGPY
jgi:hypothetical protein